MPEKLSITYDEKIRRDCMYPKGKLQNASLNSRPGADHNTTRARTSLCPVQNKRTTVLRTAVHIIGAPCAKSELEKKIET